MRNIRRILIAVLISIPIFVVWFVLNLYFGIDDAYAQWGTVDMTIDYMKSHNGKWPSNWSDLKPSFESGGGRVGGWSFEQFQHRVAIDFSANADELRKQSMASEKVSFRVIYARWTIGSGMGDGPNAMLYRYFRRQGGIIEAMPPSEGWRSKNQKALADEWYRRGFSIQLDRQERLVSAWTTIDEIPLPGDRDIAEFKHHPQLQFLNLVRSRVTDAGLIVVKQLPELKRLDLGSDDITDGCIVHLSGHPKLESLDVFGTQITDVGLQRLRELPKLKSIRFDARRISEKAVSNLKAHVRNLEIRAIGELRLP